MGDGEGRPRPWQPPVLSCQDFTARREGPMSPGKRPRGAATNAYVRPFTVDWLGDKPETKAERASFSPLLCGETEAQGLCPRVPWVGRAHRPWGIGCQASCAGDHLAWRWGGRPPDDMGDNRKLEFQPQVTCRLA